jgi:hypothetical protein
MNLFKILWHDGWIAEQIDEDNARQRPGKHMSAATNKHATTEELWRAVFSVWSVPRLYNEDKREKLLSWTSKSAFNSQSWVALLAAAT